MALKCWFCVLRNTDVIKKWNLKRRYLPQVSCFSMLFGFNTKHVYIIVRDVITLVKTCWLLCLSTTSCFCASGNFHASSVTCSVTLLALIPHERNLNTINERKVIGLWLSFVSYPANEKKMFQNHIDLNTTLSRLNKWESRGNVARTANMCGAREGSCVKTCTKNVLIIIQVKEQCEKRLMDMEGCRSADLIVLCR